MDFWKYQANGNDFVVFDDRRSKFSEAPAAHFAFICDRKKGVGADGILFLKTSMKADYKMVYLNADGGEVSMCGNGARALTHFVHHVIKLKGRNPDEKKETQYTFETMNGIYQSRVDEDGKIFLTMTELYDEDAVEIGDFLADHKILDRRYMNTGVPHCVFEVESVDEFDLLKEAPSIRYDKRFSEGVNVNVYQVLQPGDLKMRTYERGVENETLACGTGTMAVALTYAHKYGTGSSGQLGINFETPGGHLQVMIEEDKREFSGEVHLVFQGHFLDPI